jgi:dihydroorotate dehydrogenase electron transfer subunit
MKPVLSTVISNSGIMPGVSLVWIEAPQIAVIARPGQFVMVNCGEEILLRRPFSIHQVSNDKTSIAILFKVVGGGTNWLSHCKLGDELDILGPLGNGFSINSTSRNLLLVGGGIGIAPLFFLARLAMEIKCSVTMLLGASTSTQLYPNHLLPLAVDCITATNDGTTGKKGIVTDLMPKFIDRVDQIFACGPSSMYTAIAKLPEIIGKSVQASLEVRMGCGFGLCYSCTVKTKAGLKQICKNGPIFDLNDILWDEFVDI